MNDLIESIKALQGNISTYWIMISACGLTPLGWVATKWFSQTRQGAKRAGSFRWMVGSAIGLILSAVSLAIYSNSLSIQLALHSTERSLNEPVVKYGTYATLFFLFCSFVCTCFAFFFISNRKTPVRNGVNE